MQDLRRPGRPRTPSRQRPDRSHVQAWKEKELLHGKVVDAGAIILRTSGCSHFHRGGCSMCGYNVDSGKGGKPEDIVKQFDKAIEQLGEVAFLKVYTSGSFLDECEVPIEQSAGILKRCADRSLRLLVESRPEFVTKERLEDMLGIHGVLEVAIGLESANDAVLRYSINKGFTVADYDAAARLLKELGVPLRSYVLLKPPFLTEAEAVADAVATVKHVAATSEIISINPVNVQKGTLVEKLWRNWAYRSPWLWSVLEVLKATAGSANKIICEPTGGGKERGAHNCGMCDDVILDSLRAYSLTQDPARLGSPDCPCKDLWKSIVDIEGFVMGGTCDLQRFFRPQRA